MFGTSHQKLAAFWISLLKWNLLTNECCFCFFAHAHILYLWLLFFKMQNSPVCLWSHLRWHVVSCFGFIFIVCVHACACVRIFKNSNCYHKLTCSNDSDVYKLNQAHLLLYFPGTNIANFKLVTGTMYKDAESLWKYCISFSNENYRK